MSVFNKISWITAHLELFLLPQYECHLNKEWPNIQHYTGNSDMKVQTKQPNLTQQQAKASTLAWQPPAPSSNNSLPASYSNGQSKVVAWLQESEEMDKCAEGTCNCLFSCSKQNWLPAYDPKHHMCLWLSGYFYFWILSSELARCQSNLTELSRLLQSLEILQRTQSAPNFTEMQVNKDAHTKTHVHQEIHTVTQNAKEAIYCVFI